MAGKGKVMQTIVSIAGEISPTLGKSINKLCNYFSSAEGKALLSSAAIAAGAAAIGTAVVAATKKMVEMGDAYNKSVGQLSASTGLVGKDLEAVKDVADSVYKNNYGESFDEVAQAVATAKQVTGLMGDELQSVTEGAFALRDTFGYDVNETMRAAKAMMQNFGISGEEAMSMIAAGAQNGLDYSGELVDSINEYSVQFAKVGLDADAMFNILQSGADSGAWNLDKVGDAVKEFSIRAIDGSKTTTEAYQTLGLNADKMMQTFAAGGEDAQDAFKQVAQALVAIEDPVKRDAAGVQLFGTMWEDLGVEAVAAMANAKDGAYDTGNALEQINDVKYNDLGSKLQGIGRSIESAITPAASALATKFGETLDKLTPMFEKAMPYVTAFAEGFTNTIGGAIDFILPLVGPLFTTLFDGLKRLGPPLMTLWNALQPVFTLIKNVVVSVFPVLQAFLGIVIERIVTIATFISAVLSGAIQGLMPLFEVIAGRVQWVMEIMGRVFNFMKSILAAVSESVTGFVDGIITGVQTAISWVVDAIRGFVNSGASIINAIIGAINGIKVTVPDWVPLIGGQEWGLNIPLVPMLAKGGFTDGVSIAGEAGTEAVISFNPAYRNENLDYWARAGRMLGADANDYAELSPVGGGGNTFGDVVFAPQITVQGNADKQTIREAIEEEYPEFIDLLEEWFARRGGPKYA